MPSSAIAQVRGGMRARSDASNGTLRSVYLLATFVFVLSTLFDPADLLLGLKLPLYLLCWATGVLYCLSQPRTIRVPLGLIVYAALMIAIPVLSIAHYVWIDGSEPFEGLQLLKAYLFISMAVLLYITRVNLLPYLSAALSILAVAVIAVGTAVLLQPALFLPIYAFGDHYGMFSVDNRDYGSGLVLFQMYFVTSPMLAISTAYYFDRAAVMKEKRARYGLLALLNIVGMVLAGTRNNLMAAIVLPLALVLLRSKRKALVVSIIAVAAAVFLVVASDKIGILLNPAEASNRTKLTTLMDYGTILGSPVVLLLGRGLGAYEHWTGRGYYYITELTYLEIVRNFGVVLGAVMILLLLYPIANAFALRRSYPERGIIVGYVVYLVMCASNPNLFSSMGMMILSVITANAAMYDTACGRATARPDMAPGRTR